MALFMLTFFDFMMNDFLEPFLKQTIFNFDITIYDGSLFLVFLPIRF